MEKEKYINGILFKLCACGVCNKYFEVTEKRRKKSVEFIKGHFCLGKHHSDESKEKNRQSHIGKKAWNKGLTGIYSEKTLQKIRESRSKQVMIKGRHHTEESKEKNRIAHLGKIQSMEANIKRSMSLIGKPKSEQHCKNISISKSGSKSPSWLGGISKLPYTQDWTDDLRDAIRKRDSNQCQLCNLPQSKSKTVLDVHHIDYNKENCDPRNLITLCKSCHIKTNRNREMWTKHFMQRNVVLIRSIANLKAISN